MSFTETSKTALPIWPISKSEMANWTKRQGDHPAIIWAKETKFTPDAGKILLVPGTNGKLAGILFGIADTIDLWSFAALPANLPPGQYRLDRDLSAKAATDAAVGWALGCYRFKRYLPAQKNLNPTLVWPTTADRDAARRIIDATVLVRDLINTPAGDLGPVELASAAKAVVKQGKGKISVTVGDDLLQKNYPMVHAVGRAAAHAPRLIEFTWGPNPAPKVTLVGKGVCFDSGGLDIKPAAGMALMKKDMGGAATVLGLAQMIMAAKLNLRLHVLIPAVENAIAGNAFRPGDILQSRAGITVEIGNTDAEGRLILADALAKADEDRPDLLIDCATLTGAARVALGPDLPAVYSDDDAFIAEFEKAAKLEADPFWRLPLWPSYRQILDSKIADINNAGTDSMAGSITAALFLKEFVKQAKIWVHIDLFAWNNRARPGRPIGGEAMAMRALFALLAKRYPSKQKPKYKIQ